MSAATAAGADMMIGSGRECVIWPKPDRRAGSLGHSMIQPYSEGTVHSSERIASRDFPGSAMCP